MITMSKKKWIVLAVVSFVLLGGLIIYSQIQQHQSHKHQGLKEYYTCAMHPQIIKDKPGNCPICGMRLIKKTAKPEDDQGDLTGISPDLKTVSISPVKQVLANIATSEVTKKQLTKTIRTVAIVAFDRELFVAQQEYLSAVRVARRTRLSGFSTMKRQGADLKHSSYQKLKLLGMSDEEIKEIENNKKPDQSLYFPKSGDHVWINAEIYEFDRQWIRPGDPIEVTIDAFPGEVFQGSVIAITPVVDPIARTIKVRIRLPNPSVAFSPDMFANVQIRVPLAEKLAIPTSSVINTGTRKAVWVEVAAGKFVPRRVKLGARVDGYFIVLGGLNEGEKVVSQGGFLLDSEAELRSFGQTDGNEQGGHQH